MGYLMGLDIGTSGVKGILISTDGKIIASRTSTYPLAVPKAGWAEQNPEDWWRATKEVIKALALESGINSSDIKGISFSGQMHSSVFLDEKMEVIRPAILWSDTRTSKECQQIYEQVGGLAELSRMVSNPALEGFTAPKILWLRNNEPENCQKLNLVLLPKDYIRFKLSGEVYTEVSDAAGTLLFDVAKKKWSQDLLDKLGLDPTILPPVVDSIAVLGGVSREVAAETGLKEGTPLVAGGADNACGAIGSGIVKEGRVMVSIGSSGVVLAQASRPSADQEGRIHLFNHAIPGNWYMMGVMLSAGLAFSWLKEKLFANTLDYDSLNKLAQQVPAGSEGLIFLPYLSGERTPHADADARGVYFGISGKHEQGHFVRSVMEGVTFGLRDSLELIKRQGVVVKEIRAIGGGAKSKIWQQIMADIFGQEISLLNVEEGPAFGAALIAGVGVGEYSSFVEAVENIVKVREKIAPTENTGYYNRQYQIFKDIYQSLKGDFKNLAYLG